MTTAAAVAFAVAAGFAVADWWAVAAGRRRVEYVAKPVTMVALVAAAAAVDATVPGRRTWFVVALLFSLAGDVFLMLRHARADRERPLFVAGLGAFLVAHLAYVVGLNVEGPAALRLAVAAVVVAAVAVPLGMRIAGEARRGHGGALGAAVGVYVGAISAMVASALASGSTAAAFGAVLFYASDFLIGWTRFVRPVAGAPVAIMVTYHLGQGGLVLSLTMGT